MDSSRSSAVVVIGPVNGRITGRQTATAGLVSCLEQRFEQVTVVDQGLPSDSKPLVAQVTKMVRMFRSIIAVAAQPRAPKPIAFVVLNDQFWLSMDLLVVIASRLNGNRTILMHHSWKLSRSSFLIRTLRWADPSATHVALCDGMKANIEARASLRTCVMSNYAVSPRASGRPTLRGAADLPLRVAALSNWVPGKGLSTILDVAQAVSADIGAKRIEFVVAGPVSAQLSSKVQPRAAKLGVRLDGPLYSEAKERLLSDADVLLFPSTYTNESEPLVVLEALDRGCVVWATRVGCLTQDLADFALDGTEFTAHVVDRLRSYLEHPDSLTADRDRSAGMTDQLRRRADHGLEEVLASVGDRGNG